METKKYYINVKLGVIAPVGSCINRAGLIKNWDPFEKLNIDQDGDIIELCNDHLLDEWDGSYFQKFNRSIPVTEVM